MHGNYIIFCSCINWLKASNPGFFLRILGTNSQKPSNFGKIGEIERGLFYTIFYETSFALVCF